MGVGEGQWGRTGPVLGAVGSPLAREACGPGPSGGGSFSRPEIYVREATPRRRAAAFQRARRTGLRD